MKYNKNSKFLKSGLIISLITIWTCIIYKVIKSVKSNNSNENTIRTYLSTNYTTIDTIKPSPKLDYLDPFLSEIGEKQIVDSGVVDLERPKENIQRQIETTTQNSIVYLGLIQNNIGNKKIALISVDGNEILVTPGSKIQNINILSIKSSHITYSKNGLIKKIYPKESKSLNSNGYFTP